MKWETQEEQIKGTVTNSDLYISGLSSHETSKWWYEEERWVYVSDWQKGEPHVYTYSDTCVQQQVEHYGHEGTGMRRTEKEESVGVGFEKF